MRGMYENSLTIDGDGLKIQLGRERWLFLFLYVCLCVVYLSVVAVVSDGQPIVLRLAWANVLLEGLCLHVE